MSKQFLCYNQDGDVVEAEWRDCQACKGEQDDEYDCIFCGGNNGDWFPVEKMEIRPMSESVKNATEETFGPVEYTGNPFNPRACQDCG